MVPSEWFFQPSGEPFAIAIAVSANVWVVLSAPDVRSPARGRSHQVASQRHPKKRRNPKPRVALIPLFLAESRKSPSKLPRAPGMTTDSETWCCSLQHRSKACKLRCSLEHGNGRADFSVGDLPAC